MDAIDLVAWTIIILMTMAEICLFREVYLFRVEVKELEKTVNSMPHTSPPKKVRRKVDNKELVILALAYFFGFLLVWCLLSL